MRVAPAVRVRPLLFVVLFSLTLPILAVSPADAQSPTSPPKLRQHPTPPPPDPVAQEQFVAYWTSETGWTSELQLRNNAVAQDLTVTPVLRLANGAETSLAPVAIKPQEVKSVDIDAAIAAASTPQLVGAYGSVALRYLSPSSGTLYAAMMIRRTGHAVAFHIDAIPGSQDIQGGSREGIWWLPKDTVSDYLVFTNQGKSATTLDLSLYDASGRQATQKVLLGAGETTRYSIRKLILGLGLTGSYGGIKISTSAHVSSLDSLHFLYDEAAGFSAILKMFEYNAYTKLEERDYAHTGIWTVRAPMLALSNPDPALAFPAGTKLQPQLFIRNTTAKLIDATLRFNWRATGATGKAPGPALHLAPFQTRRIDVAMLQGAGTLPKEANWTSVTITTNSKPDEIMAVAASYDDTLHYGAQTPFSDQLSFKWEGGMWEYDPYHNSIITAGNGGTKPTQTAFTIFYNQGTQRYDLEQTLQPDEQMWVDVGKLIREHVPDKNGKILPADLTSGSYEFRDLSNTRIGSLFEGKVIYDKTYGHVAYGCAVCCGTQAAQLFFNPLGVPFQGPSDDGVDGLDSCSGTYVDVSDSFYGNWRTAATSIATVDGYGTHTGVSVGSTTSNTHAYMAGPAQPRCPLKYFTPGGGVNVIAIPVNFRQTSATDKGGGDLHFTYAWDSSSGNLSDLSSCVIGEYVTVQGSSTDPYPFPSPPYAAGANTPNPISATSNPPAPDLAATTGAFQDDHTLYTNVPVAWVKPYAQTAFTQIQSYEYKCTNYHNGNYIEIDGPLYIVRQVFQSNGVWSYSVSKSNAVATISPLP